MSKAEKNKSLFVSKGVDQPSSLNINALKNYKHKKANQISIEDYLTGLKNNDRTILSRAITLIESSLASDQKIAQEIVDKCLPFSGNSIRIGITGVPGVGKSTFIEALGTFLIEKGKKVAVLAVDPSSQKTKGSILGDKTRMAGLATLENAFIRPSPTAGNLGGVAQKTRESIILCEAAGFDTIIIETVGVGQSETAVSSMVDLFLMLVIAGAGDELQGIKRGIMEMVDFIVINKADDTSKEKLKVTQRTYLNALHLMPPPESGWEIKVEPCSSLIKKGIDKVWKNIEDYKDFTSSNNYFNIKRSNQSKYWLHEAIEYHLKSNFYNNPTIKEALEKFERQVLSNKKSPFAAANELLGIKKEY